MQPYLAIFTPAERAKLLRYLTNGLRHRQSQRIAQQHNPDGTEFEPRQQAKNKTKNVSNKRKMFLKLRQARHLKTRVTSEQGAIGYRGRIANIARIHQEGLLSRVSKGGSLYQYPVRELLGLSDDDQDWLMHEISSFLDQGLSL